MTTIIPTAHRDNLSLNFDVNWSPEDFQPLEALLKPEKGEPSPFPPEAGATTASQPQRGSGELPREPSCDDELDPADALGPVTLQVTSGGAREASLELEGFELPELNPDAHLLNAQPAAVRMSEHERILQLVHQRALEMDWHTRQELGFLREALESSKRPSATAQNLSRLVEQGRTVDELMLAFEIRQAWLGRVSLGPEVDARITRLTWQVCMTIIDCFQGLPDVDEVLECLDRLHELWIRTRARKEFRTWMNRPDQSQRPSRWFSTFIKQHMALHPPEVDAADWMTGG